MIYELADTSKVEKLFGGWEDTCIYSCLQKVMGKIYVTDEENPRSAMAFAGCFAFYAGEPDRELVSEKPKGFVIMVPLNESWAALIEECFPNAEKATRYAIKKNTRFRKEVLERIAAGLPAGYEMRKIDGEIYDRCLSDPEFRDLVGSFDSKEQFLELGRGMVVTKNGKVVSGVSSYTRYLGGIEIEVDTAPEERKKGLASAVSAALILSCLEEGLYPSWDAANLTSVRLARKLGYEFSHEYISYKVE